MGITHAMCNFATGIPKGHLRMGWSSFVGKPPSWDDCIDVQPNSVVNVPNEALFSAAAGVSVYVLVKDYSGDIHVHKMPASDCLLGGAHASGVERYVLPGANGFTSQVRAYAANRILPLPVEIHIVNDSTFDMEVSSVRLSKTKGLFPTYPADHISAGQTLKLICYPSIEPDAKGKIVCERDAQARQQRLKLFLTLNFVDQSFSDVNVFLLAALHGTVPGLSAMASSDKPPPDGKEDGLPSLPQVVMRPGGNDDTSVGGDSSSALFADVPWCGKIKGMYDDAHRVFTFTITRRFADVQRDAAAPAVAADEAAP